ncbi:extracellular solute-binding protein [Occultella kanbiaonis]|uniref:extracellular solute-binding protein n=1 Tax=Occultella kanbiaonis TaxID=2675754 RepID=UPI0013D09F28|nr:extracellular solute-binding protein [Occultella kanbiaonis]
MRLNRPRGQVLYGSGLDRRAFLQASGLGLVAVGALAACAPDAGEAPTGTPSGVPNVDPIELGAATDGPIYPDPYIGPTASQVTAFGSADQTFRVVVPVDSLRIADWNNNAFSTWLEERTGVKVQYEQVITTNADGGSDLTKINAILASGDLPDAFLGIDFTNDVVSLYGEQGLFVDVGDFVQTYGPEQRRQAEQYPDWRSLNLAADGRLYQIVGQNDCLHCKTQNARMFINTDYLEAVGAAVPTTTDEFREVLKAFRDRDPSGTGNMVPLTGSVKWPLENWVTNSFIYNPGARGLWLYLEGDTPAFAADKDEWREALRYMRSLFDDGSINRESFTRGPEEIQRIGNRGQIGAAAGNAWSVFMDMEATEDAAWRSYAGLAPLQGPAGVRYAMYDYAQGPNSKLVITNACANPEVLVQWADAQMELEATLRANMGPDFHWAQEGEESVDGRQAVFIVESYPPAEGLSWAQRAIMYRSNDMRFSQSATNDELGLEAGLKTVAEDYNQYAQPQELTLPPLIFEEASAAQRADLGATLTSYVVQQTAKFATAELDINDDAVWQSYLDDLDAQGLPTFLDLYKQAYDNRPASQ